jgi:hypothetical protein
MHTILILFRFSFDLFSFIAFIFRIYYFLLLFRVFLFPIVAKTKTKKKQRDFFLFHRYIFFVSFPPFKPFLLLNNRRKLGTVDEYDYRL